MKKGIFALAFAMACTLLFTSTAYAERTIGLGISPAYSGLGINVGHRREQDLRYVSAGCNRIGHSNVSGWDTECGLGVGWFHAGILPVDNNKHALGIHINAHRVSYRDSDLEKQRRTEHSLSSSYTYFFRGIDSPGFFIGGSPFSYVERDGFRIGPVFSVGYQF